MYLFINKPYIPEDIKNEKGPLLMHISDTTEESFKYVIQAIQNINPQYLVHTGDIVDNIKLETNKHYLGLYKKSLKKFINSIEIYDLTPYYVIGNHDDIDSVRKLSSKGIILEKGVIEIEGRFFYLSHKHEETNTKADYFLYGHSFFPPHYEEGNKIGLNGLLNINVIVLSTGKIYQIEYPMGINYYRKMERGSIGL